MAISSIAARGQTADINVTPLIDVLLVLLIIFMVITPLMPHGLNTVVPQQARSDQQQAPARPDIVITVCGDATVRLNSESLPVSLLQPRLNRLFARTPDDVVFVRAEKDLEFRQVAEVIDIIKGAGATRIGLMTR